MKDSDDLEYWKYFSHTKKATFIAVATIKLYQNLEFYQNLRRNYTNI